LEPSNAFSLIVVAKLVTESLSAIIDFWIVKNLGRFWYILISNITSKFKIEIIDFVMIKHVLVFMLIP
jgi:isoprenylcysteine carboxyl methyltransferase (ICMT) family protein YpbQ